MDMLKQNLFFYLLFYLNLFYYMEKTVDACSFSTSEAALVCTGELSSQSLSHYTHTHTQRVWGYFIYPPPTFLSFLHIIHMQHLHFQFTYTQTQYMHVCMHMHPHRERVNESFLHSVHMCIITSTQNYNLFISWYHY